MDTKEYKRIMNEDNILDFCTISDTLKILRLIKKVDLIIELERILEKNKIEKPFLHNKKDDYTTGFYKVDLDKNQIEVIIDLFFELEAESLKTDLEPAITTSGFYATTLDKWNNLLEDR